MRPGAGFEPKIACENARMMLDAPLSDAEFALLDDFLMSDDAPENTMDTVMLDGYLAAVVSGPTMVMPSEWLRWVWDTDNGTESPTFATMAQAQQITGLLMRHYQDVNHTLTHAPADYEPRLYEREVDGRTIPIIDEWCMGYHLGMSIDFRAWAPLLLAEPAMLQTVLLYGSDEGWEVLKKQPIDLDAHQAHADRLEPMACQVHAYWLAQRQAAQRKGEAPRVLAKPRPVRSTPKVGRNEICPCGSGKKYKHCHANQ